MQVGETSNLQGKGAPGWEKGLCTVEAHAGYRDSPDSDYGVAERWPLVMAYGLDEYGSEQ